MRDNSRRFLKFTIILVLLSFPILAYSGSDSQNVSTIFKFPVSGSLLTDNSAFSDFSEKFLEYLSDNKETHPVANSLTLKILMIDKRYAEAYDFIHSKRLTDFEYPSRLTFGMIDKSIIETYFSDENETVEDYFDHLELSFSDEIMTLPWELTSTDIIELQNILLRLNPESMYSNINDIHQNILSSGTEITFEIAEEIIDIKYNMEILLPFKSNLLTVLEAFVSANQFNDEDYDSLD